MARESQTCSCTEDGIEREGGIRAHQHLFNQNGEHLGHALPSMLRVSAQPHPAPICERLVSLPEPFGREHSPTLEATAFLITTAIDGSQDFTGHLRGTLQHRIHEISRYFGCCGHGRTQRGGALHLVQNEMHVFEGCLIACHEELRRKSGKGQPLP